MVVPDHAIAGSGSRLPKRSVLMMDRPLSEVTESELALETLFDIADFACGLPGADDSAVGGCVAASQRYTRFREQFRHGMKRIGPARDRQTGRKVAMVRLCADAPPELYEPFLREARLAALLHHPRIISVHDIGLDESGIPFFVMERVGGQSLHQLVKAYHRKKRGIKRGDQDRLLEVFLKVCDAMAFAHASGVVHLDLNPENIQVGNDGQVVVCAWGAGCVLGESYENGGEFDRMLLSPDLIRAIGREYGPSGYRAPEQHEKRGNVTPQTDIYALGAVLCAMWTGSPPVVVEGVPQYSGGNIPRDLFDVIIKAMARETQSRHALPIP